MPIETRFSLLGEFGGLVDGDLLALSHDSATSPFTLFRTGQRVREVKPNWMPRYGFLQLQSIEFGEWPENSQATECTAALSALLGQRELTRANVNAITLEALRDSQGDISNLTRAWLRYLISEQSRLEHAVEAISDGKALILGNLLDQSECILNQLLKSKQPHIERYVSYLSRQHGVLGVRRSRNAAGETVLAVLVENRRSQQICASVSKEFSKNANCLSVPVSPITSQ